MKNISLVDEVWIERLEPTPNQLQTLQNGTNAEKEALINAINIPATNADKATANQIYNLHKPTDENYSLISCDLTIGEEVRGIINCRINGEHKQIRF